MVDHKKNPFENKVFFKFSTKRMIESTESEHPPPCPAVCHGKIIFLVIWRLAGPRIFQAVLEICRAVLGKLD